MIELFRGQDAIIIPDNDLPGMEQAYTLAKIILQVASTVKVLKLPNLRIKQDLEEWISIHTGTKTELLDLAESTASLDENRVRIELTRLRTIAELNKELSFHQTGDTLRITREYLHNTGEIRTRRQEEIQKEKFAALYNRKIPYVDSEGKIKNQTQSDLWLNSPFRRTYIGSYFWPDMKIPGYYNEWKGFSVKPKQGDWSLFRLHMKLTICSGNKKHYQYLIRWMARIIQDPGGKRPGVAVVLRGGRGIGKGVFATEFGKLFGEHFKHVTNKRYLIGKNNSHQRTTLLMFADEAVYAGDRKLTGMLNNIITEDTLFSEDKYIRASEIRNHQNLIMASNNDWVVYTGLDERRFFILDVSDRHKQDRNHFAKIIEQMDNGGREAMMYDLMKVKYDPIELGNAPKTEALLAQIESSMTTLQKWWYDRLVENSAIDRSREWFRQIGRDETAPVMDSKLYYGGKVDEHQKQLEGVRIVRLMHDDYRRFALECKDSYVLDPNVFGRRLRELCPAIPKSRKMTVKSGSGKIPNVKVYDIPPLKVCREQFEKKMNRRIKWPKLNPVEKMVVVKVEQDGDTETQTLREVMSTED